MGELPPVMLIAESTCAKCEALASNVQCATHLITFELLHARRLLRFLSSDDVDAEGLLSGGIHKGILPEGECE